MRAVKGLRHRLLVFLLLPVVLLLVVAGGGGYFAARRAVVGQWQEATLLRLQRAAHQVDMRLRRPKQLLDLYYQTAALGLAGHAPGPLLEKLRQMPGVAAVALELDAAEPEVMSHPGRTHMMKPPPMMSRHHQGRGAAEMMRLHMGGVTEITPPRYDSPVGYETVSIVSELKDEQGRRRGHIEVALRFDFLVAEVIESRWWQGNRAFLVDHSGRVLMATEPGRRQLGEGGSEVEIATLAAIKQQRLGALQGRSGGQLEVSGFCRLEEAPWTLVLLAPADKVLAPLYHLRRYYLIGAGALILGVVLLIQLVTRKTVHAIEGVSRAAQDIARGKFDIVLPAVANGEVGELIASFRDMAGQLQERLRMKRALDVAMEVQRHLLPAAAPQVDGVDIAGTSSYCDETGGDYYDFFYTSEFGNGRIGIAVGDVAGHGVASALLMTTARALVRSRVRRPGSPAAVLTDVNRILCEDTGATGGFMTMFLLALDPTGAGLQWARAGHEPALLYDPATDSFQELRGPGIALGVDETWVYRDNFLPGLRPGQIVLVGTDGIWETENPAGAMFGKENVRRLIREQCRASAAEIVAVIMAELEIFRRGSEQKDDVTLVVVKKAAA